MRQQVLKALANPARIFYVPYSIAVLNFVVQFLVFIVVFLGMLVATREAPNPIYFLISVIIAHVALMGISKKEPQLANIIAAKIQLFQKKMPKDMIV